MDLGLTGRRLRRASGVGAAILILGLAALTTACDPSPSAKKGGVMVFAAASTTNAVTEICALYSSRGGGEAVPSFAASSTLAKQIQNGAPADVYISANVLWMDYLADRGRIEASSRKTLLGNRIVLIAPKASPLRVEIRPGFPMSRILGDGKLAMADPDHAPAGRYGREALESLGVWAEVEPKVARAKDVRAALALVERGEAPLGVVYATDAAISDRVRVVGRFPPDSHPPIVYQAALVAGRVTEPAESFFRFLLSPEAGAVFERHGFQVP